MNLNPGTLLQGGKYRIERVLGQGGFGITYLGYSVDLNCYVAIKEFFLKELCGRDECSHRIITHVDTATIGRFKAKFLKEARMLMSLSHRNIVRVFDCFEENDTAYYVMEYIEGNSLNDIIRMSGKLDEPTALSYIRKVAAALHYIHSMNINHLDVKPGNILLRKRDNEIVLIDFGTAKHYDTVTGGATTMTNAGYSQGYAAIEQYRQGGVSTFTPETDIYSLGATLYKMLTGQTPPEPSLLIENGLPSLPSWISAGTRSAITAAMQISKASRPHSVPEFMEILEGKDATKVIDESTDVFAVPHTDHEASSTENRPVPNSSSNNNNGTSWGWIVAVIVIIIVCVLFGLNNNEDSKNTIPEQNISRVENAQTQLPVSERKAQTPRLTPVEELANTLSKSYIIVDKCDNLNKVFFVKHKRLYVRRVGSSADYEINDFDDYYTGYVSIYDYAVSPDGNSILLHVNHGGAHEFSGLLKLNKRTEVLESIDEWTHFIERHNNEYVVYRPECINEATATCSADMIYKYRKMHYDFNGNLTRKEMQLVDK